MCFQKIKTSPYCVGKRHHISTTKIVGDITLNKQTCKEVKFFIDRRSVCNRKEIMTVSDNTIAAEGLGEFFWNLIKKGPNISKSMAKIVQKNPG